MAMSDYGFIAKKNRVLLKADNGFMDMQESVGYINEMDGNWFAFLGDQDLFIAIYKTAISIVKNGERYLEFWNLDEDCKLPYEKYRKYVTIDNVVFDFKRIGESQFKVRFRYKDNLYECVYGYGVGEQVYEWWSKYLGLSKKRVNKELRWRKYI